MEFEDIFGEDKQRTQIQGITETTQEDGSISSALAWLSASMTALEDRDLESGKCMCKWEGGIHCFFLNPVSPTDPKSESMQTCWGSAGCDEFFVVSLPRVYLVVCRSLLRKKAEGGKESSFTSFAPTQSGACKREYLFDAQGILTSDCHDPVQGFATWGSRATCSSFNPPLRLPG